jgi:hypothetical protein
MVQDVVEPALDAARQSCGVIVGYLVKRLVVAGWRVQGC